MVSSVLWYCRIGRDGSRFWPPTAFGMSVTPVEIPEGPCGLTVDTYCLDSEEWAAADDGQKAYALESARVMLNHLTAGAAANCQTTYRPCGQPRCGTPIDGVLLQPALVGGAWFNVRPCGCMTDCWHADPASRLRMPRPVAEVTDVFVDGVALSPDAYRLQGGWLIRVDGTPWPTDQDLSLDWTEPGTFAVIYRPGYPLGLMGERALGVLVREFLRACSGKRCALPSGLQTLSRQGATFNVEQDPISDGVLGIREVDFYTATINPNRLRQAPAVYIPGSRH